MSFRSNRNWLISDGMKVTFGRISTDNTHYSIKETGWFPAEEFPLRELLYAEIDMVKKDNETVLLTGELQATVGFLCDRCGEPFDSSLSSSFHYLFKTGEDMTVYVPEMECGEEDFGTVFLDEPVVDIDAILREQVLLAAPESKVCADDCRGLCPGCGAVLRYEACRCEPEPADSPFAVLKNLKKP